MAENQAPGTGEEKDSPLQESLGWLAEKAVRFDESKHRRNRGRFASTGNVVSHRSKEYSHPESEAKTPENYPGTPNPKHNAGMDFITPEERASYKEYLSKLDDKELRGHERTHTARFNTLWNSVNYSPGGFTHHPNYLPSQHENERMMMVWDEQDRRKGALSTSAEKYTVQRAMRDLRASQFKIRSKGVPKRFTAGRQREINVYKAAWDESKHTRQSKGGRGGGRFAPGKGKLEPNNLPGYIQDHYGKDYTKRNYSLRGLLETHHESPVLLRASMRETDHAIRNVEAMIQHAEANIDNPEWAEMGSPPAITRANIALYHRQRENLLRHKAMLEQAHDKAYNADSKSQAAAERLFGRRRGKGKG